MELEEEKLKQKKKEKRYKIATIVLTCFVVVFCSVFITLMTVPLKKTFTREGFEITLTNKFTEKQNKDSLTQYSSSNIAVTVLKETFNFLESKREVFEEAEMTPINRDSTIEQYIEAAQTIYEISLGFNTTEKGVVFFDYHTTENENAFFHRAFVFKTTTAFWRVEFGCETKNKYNLLDTIMQYANTIKIDNIVA